MRVGGEITPLMAYFRNERKKKWKKINK